MDRAAGAGTGLVPGLHGCLLGADADLARRRPARAQPAQGQARWAGSGRTLIRMLGDAQVLETNSVICNSKQRAVSS